jgi:hypothetical protein
MAEMQAERPGIENAPENEQDAMQEDPTGPESIEILQVRLCDSFLRLMACDLSTSTTHEHRAWQACLCSHPVYGS